MTIKATHCEICIVTDTIVKATHTCETCGFEICDNEANHILDHGRFEAASEALEILKTSSPARPTPYVWKVPDTTK